jgi:hypothetical protein
MQTFFVASAISFFIHTPYWGHPFLSPPQEISAEEKFYIMIVNYDETNHFWLIQIRIWKWNHYSENEMVCLYVSYNFWKIYWTGGGDISPVFFETVSDQRSVPNVSYESCSIHETTWHMPQIHAVDRSIFVAILPSKFCNSVPEYVISEPQFFNPLIFTAPNFKLRYILSGKVISTLCPCILANV